ncbi:MerR family transcriptional regulator [Undibacterium parvum]|uniref:MerR family transcriptional regulator n=1 Tax=Undibacterium parvum TaxID=401471 RepID=A0A3Q9BQ76_9BURK|nr:MerR family transcriptional regulator [Undibacterium parvum]AZP11935.1 MerR family transcriptional regulator [Undibacterium parvum]
MLLKIGELASRSGLTVRTLHHYDELGLLAPSARSEAGYRLYNRNDVARLHRILALRQLGLSLAEVATTLASEGEALPGLIARQLQALNLQISQAVRLRDRLSNLQDTLQQAQQGGLEPELADWLATLELMTMYDKYFSSDEQAELQRRKNDPVVAEAQLSWPVLIAEVKQLMAAACPVDEPRVLQAAQRWSDLVRQFTGGKPDLMVKSAQMMLQESGVQAQTGIDPAMMAYMAAALAEQRLAIYARYLNPAEMQKLRSSYGKNGLAWLPLIARVRALMHAAAAADSAQVQAACAEWEQLTQAFAGVDPGTRQKMWLALQQEPQRLARTGVDQALLAFVRAAGVDAVC